MQIEIVKNRDIKADIFNNISFAKEFWESPEDPNYAVIKLKPVGFEYKKPESIEAVKIEV